MGGFGFVLSATLTTTQTFKRTLRTQGLGQGIGKELLGCHKSKFFMGSQKYSTPRQPLQTILTFLVRIHIFCAETPEQTQPQPELSIHPRIVERHIEKAKNKIGSQG